VVAVPHPGPQAPWEGPPAPSEGFREGQREKTVDLEEIRWGDADSVTVVVAPAFIGGGVVRQASKQLLHAHLDYSRTWLVLVNVDLGVVVPAGEVNPVNVDFRITIGCGQSRTTFSLRIVLTAANGYQVPPGTLPPQITVPAQDIQVDAMVSYTPTVSGNSTLSVAAMAAPTYTRREAR
jgi:hypothetical protein